MKTIILINDRGGQVLLHSRELMNLYDCDVSGYDGTGFGGGSHGILFQLIDQDIVSQLLSPDPEVRPSGVILDYQVFAGDEAKFRDRAANGPKNWHGWDRMSIADLDRILSPLGVRHEALGGGMKIWEALCELLAILGENHAAALAGIPKILHTGVAGGGWSEGADVVQFKKTYDFATMSGTAPNMLYRSLAHRFGLKAA